MTIIAVDFDETLTADSGDPYKAGGEKPDMEMVEYVTALKEDDQYDIVIWTARPWSHAGHIAGLLTMWGVPYNGLKCEKGGAHVYLDDKAVNHQRPGWESRVTALADHNNHDPDQKILEEYDESERSSADA